MTMVESAFGDLAPLQDLDMTMLSPLKLHLSNGHHEVDAQPDPELEPEPPKRTAKRRQSSVSERGKNDQPRMLACLTCRQKKIKVQLPRSANGTATHIFQVLPRNQLLRKML